LDVFFVRDSNRIKSCSGEGIIDNVTVNFTLILYTQPLANELMLSLACRDAGVKDCDYVAKGETEDELWKDGTEHVIKVHGMKAEDVTPEFKDSHRPYIKQA